MSVTNKKSIQNINLNIDNETITDDKVISNHFNKFFSSIAGKLVRKIPNTTKTFDLYLNKQSEKSFFLSPILPDDIEATAVLVGNDTFLTENIIEDRKKFITPSKHMIF